MNQVPSIFSRPGVRTVSEAATADLGPGMHPRISIKGGRFTLIDAGGTKYPWPNLNLPVIIVGANPKKSKVYYENGFDPDASTPPTCYSDNGVAPSINATRKMARTCAECELGAWGSDTSPMTGKATKACNDKKKLAVIVVGDTAGHAYELQIPPASLKNLNKHAGLIASHTVPDGSRKADLSDMVTSVSFVPDQVGVLDFQPLAWIDSVGPNGQLTTDAHGAPVPAVDGGASIAMRLDEIWESEVVDELVGLNDKAWTGTQLPAPPAQQALPPQSAPAHALAPFASQRALPPPGVPSPFPVPAGAQPAQPQTAFPPATAPAEPAKRGGARPGAGRPKQVAAPQGTVSPFPAPPPGPPGEMPPIPPFLQRTREPAPQHGMMERQQAEPVPQHGMQQAAPPPSGIQAAVNAAFGLSTKPTQ